MTDNILRVIRMILLIMIVGFVGLMVYKYFVNGFADWSYSYPIIGLAFVYLVTQAGLKQK
jgi:uncharacterized membrane protein